MGTVICCTLFWEQFYAVLCLKDSFGNSSLQYVVLRAVLGTVTVCSFRDSFGNSNIQYIVLETLYTVHCSRDSFGNSYIQYVLLGTVTYSMLFWEMVAIYLFMGFGSKLC